jgi:hypothetical protein
MKSTVTLAEICEALGLADSSARRYVKTFKAFFPVVSEGFPVRYRGEAVEIMGMIVAAMKERRSRAEIEAALARAGHSRDVVKSSSPATTSPQFEIVEESVVKMVAKSSAEALEVNRRILAALERQNALLDCQNMLLEKLTLAGVALPGKFPPDSPQEAPGATEEGGVVEPEGAVPENAENGQNRPSWWNRLWKRK